MSEIAATPKASFRDSLRLLIRYIWPERGRALLLLALLFGGIGLQLLQPQILAGFIDLAIGAVSATPVLNLRTLPATAVAFLVVAIFNQLLTAAAAYVTQDVRWRTTNALRADLAAHALRLDMGYHNARTPGEMIARVDEEVNLLSNFLSQFIIQIFGNGILILGVIVILFNQDWRIGLGFFAFVLVTGRVLSWVIRLAVPYWEQFNIMGARLFSFIEERLAGMEDIRANGAGAYTMLQLHRTLRDQYVVEQKGFAFFMLTWTTTEGFFRIGTALGLLLGGLLFQQNIVTLGTVYLIVNYSAMLQEPLRRLTQQLQDLQRAIAAVGRIGELFQVSSAIVDTAPADALLPDGPLAVTFDDVYFRYKADTPVLRGVSFALAPGNVLGLLGRTGSGKTTMTRLLFRLYEADAGEVRLAGRPITAVPLAHLRSKVGLVTQDVQLFNATIRDNLTFFSAAISDERILNALRSLELMPWFESLPAGLDTSLESGGRSLSAGEAQLLAFTRVFLQDPGLIILDEASSRLDPATEFLIERAVAHLLANRSAIIVAHRLATVQRADDILILEDGQVKEYGRRQELASDPDSYFAQLLRTGMTEVLA